MIPASKMLKNRDLGLENVENCWSRLLNFCTLHGLGLEKCENRSLGLEMSKNRGLGLENVEKP